MCYRYQHSNDPYDNMHAKIHSMTTCMHFNSMHESSPQSNEWTCMKKGRQWAIMHGKAMCGHACQERACMYGHWPKVRFLTTYHQNWICMFMSADGHAWSWHECGHAMSCMQTHTRTHVHMLPTQPGFATIYHTTCLQYHAVHWRHIARHHVPSLFLRKKVGAVMHLANIMLALSPCMIETKQKSKIPMTPENAWSFHTPTFQRRRVRHTFGAALSPTPPVS